ncbi:SET domain-containing protein 3 [Paraconiothyrium brasiliense]|uniref:SET domain-containing protein 3 n=1 Tax=Paraconiothyrium brasiliense TaxID=300254 RepID=A0ABR3R337_9PLEO
MTDVSSIKAHADHQPASVAHYGPPPPAFTNDSPALDGTIEEEESSTIKCICGFSDDDGNTVLCEKCDTWQHIVCYYESASHVPDVHECVDCLPRPVDRKSAVDKQRQRRELHNFGERKGRPRTTTKSHKKRQKDPLGSVQPNGWAIQSNNDLHYNPDRKSGSPRDLPPPAKRPKTSHRPSTSIISQAPALAPGSRKRGSSVMLNGHSPVKSPINPEGPIEEFSLEFMNLYRQAEPPSTDTNSFTDLRVTNDIASWLNDRDALAEATEGKTPADVFQRIDQSIEDMEKSLAPVVIKQTEEDHNTKAYGLHPQWHLIIVETPVAKEGFIGELKGRIGRKDDYYNDPANRWQLLQHPEPFVFFPPHLPIYIDTRHEGTILRYARRSCNPNMEMKILTQGPESGAHFCFLATRDIEPGEELTVGWNINDSIMKQLVKVVTNGDIKKEGLKKIQPWIACVLANFGGCACDNGSGHECLLQLARRTASTYAEPAQPSKTARGRKTKKIQVSPLSTGHATNSRAGSEAIHRDAQDDENGDSRSTSGSHKSSSRDITPATHFSLDESNGKMSERERRKLQQQERLFEQMDYDEQHKGKRGKRNSAGSTLNTPSLSSSKQLGHNEPSPSSRHPREHSNGVARKASGGSSRTNGRVPSKPKPVYTDSSTQTEDKMAVTDAPAPSTRPTRPHVSFKRRLLQQAQDDKIQRERIRSASVKLEMNSPALKDVTSTKPSPTAPSIPLEEPAAMDISTDTATDFKPQDPTTAEESTPTPSIDVDMKDAEVMAAPKPSTPKVEETPDAPSTNLSPTTSHPFIQPRAPPWATSTAPADAEPHPVPQQHNTTEMRLELPNPTLIIPASTTGATLGATPTAITGSAVAQSPGVGTALSPFSPAVTSAVTPGPARKKLSLSDYTSRRAKLAQQSSTAIGMPPLNPTQSNSSPTLSNASLPNNTSPPAKSVESALTPVAEEPKSTATTTIAPTTSSTST